MKPFKVALTGAAFLFAGIVAYAQSPYTYDDGFERSTPEAEGVSSRALAQAVRELADGGYDVHGLMILRHNKVIAEHWWAPFAPEYHHSMYSATKTFTGCAIGFAVQEGLLDINDKVISFFPDLLPEQISPELDSFTVYHLLTMSAGHRSTSYKGSGEEQIRSFLAMNFAHKPGEVFAYNITCSHILGYIITRLTGLSEYEYLKPRLLDPLGIKDIVWEMDMDGRNLGNGGMHLKTSDLAKLATFLKDGGKWEGRQLLSAAWVKDMTTPHIYQRGGASEGDNAKDDGGQGYGYQTWMGRYHSYRAIGGQNQLAMVIPDYDLVIAATGMIMDEAGFCDKFFALLDGLSDKKLKADKTFNLNKELEGYAYRLPFGQGDASAALKSRTLRYRVMQNDYGLESLVLRFDAQGNCQLTLENQLSLHNISFGLDSWIAGSTDKKMFSNGTSYPNNMNVTPQTVAGYCSWTAADQMKANILSLFNNGAGENYVFDFSNGYDNLTVTISGPQSGTAAGPRTATRQPVTLTAVRLTTTL